MSKQLSFFGCKLADAITKEDCEKFVDSLDVEPVTLKEKLFLLQACWAWAVEKEIVSSNPWVGIHSPVKIPPKQPPLPFTKAESSVLLTAYLQSLFLRYSS